MAASAKNNFDEPQDIDSDIRETVLAQLKIIRENKLFRDTTRMKRFLSYVVNEALDGRSDRLKGYTIGLEVFDRPDDFDPQADTIVRVQAGQLRRRLDVYYSDDGKSDPVRIVIPKGQYSPIFEMRHTLLEADDKVINIEGMDDDKAAIDKIVQLHNKSRPGIAVLTFEDLGGNTDVDFFAEGLTAEIVNALAQFRYLRIVSQMPTVSSRKEVADVKAFAQNYDVQFILSGSVRRVEDVFRVAVNLMSATTGEHIFTKIFDKHYSASNVFDLQEDIASYTAAKVAAPYGVVNRFNRRTNLARVSNMPAYEALLKFYDLKLLPSMAKGKELLAEFETITETQPQYSSGWAIRSILNVSICTQAMPVGDIARHLEEALASANKAAKIDPENALGFMALFMTFYHMGEFEKSEKMAQRAMSLNPNDYSMLAYYAITNAFRNNVDRAQSYQAASIRLIDKPPIWFYMTNLILEIREKRFDGYLSNIIGLSNESASGIQIFSLASMGHQEQLEQAKGYLKEFRHRNSNYDKDLKEAFLAWRPDESLQEIVFEGWRLSGLDI